MYNFKNYNTIDKSILKLDGDKDINTLEDHIKNEILSKYEDLLIYLLTGLEDHIKKYYVKKEFEGQEFIQLPKEFVKILWSSLFCDLFKEYNFTILTGHSKYWNEHEVIYNRQRTRSLVPSGLVKQIKYHNVFNIDTNVFISILVNLFCLKFYDPFLNVIINGSGDFSPLGILNAGISSITDDYYNGLLDTKRSINMEFRNNTKWILNEGESILKNLRYLDSGTDFYYYVDNDSERNRLLGLPVIGNEYLNNKDKDCFAILGDLSKYYLILCDDIYIRMVCSNNQTNIYKVLIWTDGMPVNNDAFCIYRNKYES